MDEIDRKVPRWFWMVALAALVWELIGVSAFASQASMSAADVAALPEGQRRLFTAMPTWLIMDYAIAVFSGLAGGFGLLLRRRWARPLFILSLAAVLIQFGWVFVVAKAHEVVGPSAFGLPAAIILIAAASVWFATIAADRGWLR